MHLTNFVADAGVEQNTLGGGGFTRVHVSCDTDVTVLFDRSGTCHDNLSDKNKGTPGPLVTANLEAEVRERFVRFSHTVNVFALLNSSTTTFDRIHHFAS